MRVSGVVEMECPAGGMRDVEGGTEDGGAFVLGEEVLEVDLLVLLSEFEEIWCLAGGEPGCVVKGFCGVGCVVFDVCVLLGC